MTTRLLGVDPGSRRCGLALSDSRRTLAFPRPSLEVNDDLLQRLGSLVHEESVGQVVVGRPVALSGGTTASTERADRLFVALGELLVGLSVVQWDERLTTVEAGKSLVRAGIKTKQHRAHIDSAAAVVMLQNYLDALRAG